MHENLKLQETASKPNTEIFPVNFSGEHYTTLISETFDTINNLEQAGIPDKEQLDYRGFRLRGYDREYQTGRLTIKSSFESTTARLALVGYNNKRMAYILNYSQGSDSGVWLNEDETSNQILSNADIIRLLDRETDDAIFSDELSNYSPANDLILNTLKQYATSPIAKLPQIIKTRLYRASEPILNRTAQDNLVYTDPESKLLTETVFTKDNQATQGFTSKTGASLERSSQLKIGNDTVDKLYRLAISNNGAAQAGLSITSANAELRRLAAPDFSQISEPNATLAKKLIADEAQSTFLEAIDALNPAN